MRLPVRALAAVTLLPALAGPAVAGDTPSTYNGVWTVQLVADAGSCGSSASYTVALQDGTARYLPGPGDASASVSGQVSGNGSVVLAMRRSIASGTASGQLRASSGSGTWQVASFGCSGRWTAKRRSTQVAGALSP